MKKLVLLILCGALIAGGAYFYYQKAHKPVAQQAVATPVGVFTAKKIEVFPKAGFVSKIESRDRVALRARVEGFLENRLFNEGDMVTEGQLLFTLEKENFEANVRQAEANLSKAEAQLKNAQAQYNRSLQLFKTKDVSEARLDEAKASYESAKAGINQAKAQLDLAKKDLEYTDITAPMDGKIGEAFYSNGELVGPSSGALANIVRINPIDAVFSVSENQLLLLQQQFMNKPGVKVSFELADGRTYEEPGKINFIDNALDENMNTLKLKASFSNPKGNLISGQYGRIIIESETPQDELVVPMKAVQRDLAGEFVYKVNADNTVEKQDVKTGLELPDYQIVVLSGLNEGDKVITEGYQKVKPGMKVVPDEISATQTNAQ